MEHENKKKGKRNRWETRQEVPTVLNTKCCHPVEISYKYKYQIIHKQTFPQLYGNKMKKMKNSTG